MSQKKILSNYFFIFILISFAVYFLWLLKLLNDFPWRYVFTDWIINYKGGYIRRGLLGEISINLSIISDTNIKYIFFIIHLMIYGLFHWLFYKFFSNFKRNYAFYLFCFSPLVFLYPISTFEAFARKEIFYITFYLLNCYILLRTNNRNIAFFATNFFILLSYFIHESSLFFIFFYYFSYFVFLKRKGYKIKLNELILKIIIFITLVILSFIPVTDKKLSEMVLFISQNFYQVSESTGAISWLQGNLSDALRFWISNPIDILDIMQHLLFLHFLVIFFFLLYKNNFFKSGKYFIGLTILTFLSPLALFVLGFDWGRFVYVLYNFTLIFTFYCLYDCKEIFLKIDNLSDIIIKNHKLKVFLTISYISLWSPKIFYNDKTEFFALIKVILKLINYSIKYGLALL